MNLPDKYASTIAAAFFTAIDQWELDVKAQRESGNERLAKGFERQMKELRDMLERMGHGMLHAAGCSQDCDVMPDGAPACSVPIDELW